jgi:hypothetical protein
LSKRQKASDLYQVDFMAALFGGFLLIWLSGGGETEFPSDTGKKIVFFEVSAKAYYRDINSAKLDWAPIWSDAGVTQGCANFRVIALAASSTDRALLPCHVDDLQPLSPFSGEVSDYTSRVDAAAKAVKRDTYVDNRVSIDGTHLRFIYQDGALEREARLVGMALTRIDSNESKPLGTNADMTLIQVGVLDSSALGKPMYVEYDKAGRVPTFSVIVPLVELGKSKEGDVIDADHYYFLDVPADVGWPHYQAAPSRLEATIRFDRDSGGGCLHAQIDIPAAVERVPLRSC